MHWNHDYLALLEETYLPVLVLVLIETHGAEVGRAVIELFQVVILRGSIGLIKYQFSHVVHDIIEIRPELLKNRLVFQGRQFREEFEGHLDIIGQEGRLEALKSMKGRAAGLLS